jgi:hypothetical protein
MQLDQAKEVLGQLRAVRSLPGNEAVLFEPGVAHVHDRKHWRAKGAAVVRQAGESYAREVGTVIRPLARDEDGARGLVADAVVVQADLERRIDGLGAGVYEKDPVEALRKERRQLFAEGERLWMGAH